MAQRFTKVTGCVQFARELLGTRPLLRARYRNAYDPLTRQCQFCDATKTDGSSAMPHKPTVSFVMPFCGPQNLTVGYVMPPLVAAALR